MLAALAWRNIWRQPWRTALSLTSIALAGAITIFILSLQLGVYGTMKENVLRLVDGFAQVQPPGYALDPDLRKTIAGPAALMRRLEALPQVTATAPRATSYAILSNGPRSYGAAVVGIDPAREPAVSTLGATVSRGRYLEPGDDDAAVIGAGLARNLKLAPGGQLTLLGEAADGSIAADVLTVKGIFATGTPELDRQLVEMPLARFQDDFALYGAVNTVAISGKHLSAIQSARPGIAAIARERKLVLRDWGQLEPALNDAILLDMSFSSLLYVSLIVIVVFIILNTLLMSVLERTREFGMLLALGMRPGQIGRMLWLELLILAAAGSAIGVSLGGTLVFWLSAHGVAFAGAEALFHQWHMPSRLFPELSPLSLLGGPLAIAGSIALSGIVPYRHILRLRPIDAMRAA
ncbi:MAG: FtsX-like permease family protein [Sphingomonas sp.]|uniref:ABC transporter permease n=1 Tax=Sphingomonas sp. TaxID=28214 RepID=UPI0035659E30